MNRSSKHHRLLTSVALGQVTPAVLLGYLARTAAEEDHHHDIAAALRSPADWRRPVGRTRSTWLKMDDLQSLNFGVTKNTD